MLSGKDGVGIQEMVYDQVYHEEVYSNAKCDVKKEISIGVQHVVCIIY